MLFPVLFATDFMPHLYAARGVPDEPWLLASIDMAIAVAYFAIVLVVLQAFAKRRDLLFRRVAVLLAFFMGFRGFTQILLVWTVWHPQYQLGGAVRAGTVILSVGTAVVLVRLLPVLHRIPSFSELEKEITERRRAENAAREREERLRNFVDSVQDYSMFQVDAEGIVQTWNSGAERMEGYTAAEIVGHNISCFYPAEDVAAGRPDFALRTAVSEGRFETEGWRIRKDGSRFWANVIVRPMRDLSGAVTGFSKVIRDMTQSRLMEAKYETLLEVAPDAILIVGRQGRILFANQRVEELFGYTREDVLGRSVDALLESVPDAMAIVNAREGIELANLQTERPVGYPRMELVGESVDVLAPGNLRESHAEHRDDDIRSPKKREMGAELDLMAVRKDGTQFPVEISLSPLEAMDGVSVTAVIRDISERKQVERQLAEKMTELRQSNEALEQFAHIASHDLQEPLRMVASYTQLLSRRYKGRLDADADEFIGFAVDGTQRMKRLIEDLLTYSRAGRSGLPEKEFQSEDALLEALGNLKTAIEESGAEVTWDALPQITAAELQLVQLFQNLIGNAIKYCGERKPRIHVAAAKNEKEWTFSVADNGIGIDKQYFDRVFVIFQRLHGGGKYEGTGIGLAICKRILQQQGGRIWVESEPGVGSTFYFALPMR